ncbi:MAG: GNAT family N-acetyltransferase [Nitrospirae bacterium]|nr:MAG: GNAT family N-acetyltransferase [Nitrospirota bacterium]
MSPKLAEAKTTSQRPLDGDRRRTGASTRSFQDRRLTVETISDFGSFLSLAPVWDHLVERAGIDHPFLRHDWVRIWWDCFGTGKELRIFVVKAGEEAVAIAPFMLSRGRMCGCPVRLMEFISNVYTERFDLVLTRSSQEACRAIWRHLMTQKGLWDVVRLCQLPAGSRALEELPRLATADGFLTGIWRSLDSPFIDLTGGWEAYLKGLSSNQRHNVRRWLYRLGQLGEVKLEVISSGEQLDAALNDGFRIEASDWKSRSGTAILCQSELKRFLTQLAGATSRSGLLRLIFLTVGQSRIAFAYALCYRNKLFVLKAGYDPQYATYSPYNLLCYLVFRDACERGLAEYEFLGASESWKLHWTKQTRSHYWLYVFSTSLRIRLLYYAKFRVVPSLERLRCYRFLRDPVVRLSGLSGFRRMP